MITAYFDVKPAAPPARRQAAKRKAPAPPKPREASTTSVLAKFEPLDEEADVPRAAEAAGRQQWRGLLDTEVKDDELADWDGFDDGGDEEDFQPESEDESEPDFEVGDSLDSVVECDQPEPSSSLDDAAYPPPQTVFCTRRRQRAAAPPVKAVYAGPLLCCEDDDDFY